MDLNTWMMYCRLAISGTSNEHATTYVHSASVREPVYTCSIIYVELTAQKEKTTGEKGPAAALKLQTTLHQLTNTH